MTAPLHYARLDLGRTHVLVVGDVPPALAAHVEGHGAGYVLLAVSPAELRAVAPCCADCTAGTCPTSIAARARYRRAREAA